LLVYLRTLIFSYSLQMQTLYVHAKVNIFNYQLSVIIYFNVSTMK